MDKHYERELLREIDSLREDNIRLRSALKTIRWKIEATNPQAWRMREVAHEALYGNDGENK
ncbi:hypothetical protein CW357_00970 [Rummeliibacillus sp. TYF005]|uniref:hypothetical protein n=1 Tax=Rummeliibacillus sp. TYF005 TaxID=2058214 RepID=UPI000F53C7AD|nr:hypothetical protein [Rummeliibacillus sp. TYF005]RPJ97269.1 hypothetical protein CW357_00970 [Rummeliibacillus sp. TYF005]